VRWINSIARVSVDDILMDMFGVDG
jgi:hypothetical protein